MTNETKKLNDLIQQHNTVAEKLFAMRDEYRMGTQRVKINDLIELYQQAITAALNVATGYEDIGDYERGHAYEATAEAWNDQRVEVIQFRNDFARSMNLI